MSKKNYTYKEATPEQIKEWNDTELKWWGDHSMMIIIIASASIFGLIGLMGLTMAALQISEYQ